MTTITPVKNPVPLPHLVPGPLRRLMFGDTMDVDLMADEAYWQRRVDQGEAKIVKGKKGKATK